MKRKNVLLNGMLVILLLSITACGQPEPAFSASSSEEPQLSDKEEDDSPAITLEMLDKASEAVLKEEAHGKPGRIRRSS